MSGNVHSMNQVCLFFYANGQFLIHGCSLSDAETYGDFLIYPGSHFEIWDEHYASTYSVDYDFFPRGRVAYHRETEIFEILYDCCIEEVIRTFAETHYTGKVSLGHDEHYQCHKCNGEYVV